ncbi:hypothetical protein AGMMS49921_05180 [Endomicrobiia bacterium]|nr:hypothetical protein AGMMS49921_05180 [Endomicrobiia bacterium]
MKHIDETKIDVLLKIEATEKEIDDILEKTKQLKRLSLEESAKLLSVKDFLFYKRFTMLLPT